MPRPAARALRALAAALLGAASLSAPPAWAAPPTVRSEGMGAAVTGGKVTADIRWRYEKVKQGGFGPKAEAGTLRTRLGYRTGDLGGSTVFVEFENIVTLGPDDYNSTTNGRTAYPVVGDPEGTEVNQVYLERRMGDGVTFRAGRQRIVLDNARFVGNVGWRENEQTFDAVSLTDAHAGGTTFTYAYIWNVDRTDFSDRAHDTHLVHLRHADAQGRAFSAYAYLVDDATKPGASSATYGARFAGARQGGGGFLNLEYARQGAYAHSGLGSNDYRMAELGGGSRGAHASVAYEVLGGDGTDAFQTPLATLHAFDGWADQFTTTPPQGLSDLAYTVTVAGRGAELKAVYHDFQDDGRSLSYGTEWDYRLEKRAGAHTFGVAYATYHAEGLKVDTDKLWVYTQARF